jgi:general nucleoside transport system permease protein
VTERIRRLAIGVAPAFLAVVLAVIITSVVLLLVGASPLETFSTMIDYGTQPRSLVLVLNQSTTFYLAAVAVAIGFKMNLFNIGVDGQYRMAAFFSAVVAGNIALPPVLHVGVTVVVAMLVGAMWAGVAGLLRTIRGVSEVISTIMLNFIATGIIAFLLSPDWFAVSIAGSNNIGTPPIPPSGQVPGIPLIPGTEAEVYGFILVAIAVGVAYWFLLNRTRLGFDLRASGMSEPAAVASGVDVKRMILVAMLLSGAVAGLVGLPQLLGASYTYALDFPAGIGFTGIAIALLGRNSPVGIAFAALLWAFLDTSRTILDLEGISKEIVTIMQGTIVLCVVIAYELFGRYNARSEQRRVARELAEAAEVAA